MGCKRLQSDPNVYVLISDQVYVLAYVDDLMVIGPAEAVRPVLDMLHSKSLLKETGTMNDEGSEAQFLGRFLIRAGGSIEFYMAADYLNP